MPGRTVLVVDDHPVFRRGLRAILEEQPWVQSVLEAGTVQEAVGLARTTTIDVTVMDLRLPDGDGLQATRRVLDAQPGVRILVLSMSDEQEWIAQALEAGARGYVVKLNDPEVIVAAVQTVAYGGLALGPDVASSALHAGPHDVRLPPPLDRLNPREVEILTRLASGESTAAMARSQHVSDKTMSAQLSGICAKLGVADRLHAALLARDHGLGRHLEH